MCSTIICSAIDMPGITFPLVLQSQHLLIGSIALQPAGIGLSRLLIRVIFAI